MINHFISSMKIQLSKPPPTVCIVAVIEDLRQQIQKYSSNANFTVNWLHSVFGVDYYNILSGLQMVKNLLLCVGLLCIG